MRAGLIKSLIVASAFMATVGSAGNHETALRQNLLELTGNRGATYIFAPSRLEQLRNLARNKDNQTDIDQLLRNEAQIEISIRPEARVSVARAAAAPPASHCGDETALLIRIVNQSYITSGINVQSGNTLGADQLAISPITPALSGEPVEYRVLNIHPKSQGPVEIALRFDAGPGTADLGSRSTVPLLLTCAPLAASSP